MKANLLDCAYKCSLTHWCRDKMAAILQWKINKINLLLHHMSMLFPFFLCFLLFLRGGCFAVVVFLFLLGLLFVCLFPWVEQISFIGLYTKYTSILLRLFIWCTTVQSSIVVWYWSILPMSFSATLQELKQLYGWPDVNEATLKIMGEYIT